MNLRTILILMAANLFVVDSYAQFSIRGWVTSEQAQDTLVGATVQLDQTDIGTVTDDQGKFLLQGVKPGSHTLLIQYLGYVPKTLDVNVLGDLSLNISMSPDARLTDEVIVRATRAMENSPTTFTTLEKPAIRKQNFGQDLPFVLNWTPSLVTTSDAGAGVGYTGLRIRGSDATRINVTINGIPLNDSESQGVFWVDVPDIATSTQSIQIQRGVGTSTNGAGAFGASINLQTNTRNDEPYAETINTYGSFNTHRHTVGFGTGLINNKFVFDGRASLIRSDGYIDRAASNLHSYYFSGGYYGKKTMVKAILFGGNEVTYQSWYGVPQSRLNNDQQGMLETAAAEGWNTAQTDNLLSSNSRTFNFYTYKDQVDNYGQDHYQLHLSHRFNPSLTANASLHYTHGRGYYEEFKYNADLSNYGVNPVTIGDSTITNADLIRRRWLDNQFYGATYSIQYDKDRLSSVLGGAWNHYDGDHFGEITWAAIAVNTPKDFRYYFNNGSKYDFNVYWKVNYNLTDKLTGFLDLQLRTINYKATGIENEQEPVDVNVQYRFFNPKIGLNYALSSEHQLYASYSVANREPVREDFINASSQSQPKAESLGNIEAGWRLRKSRYSLNVNYYLMDYRNQLVLTGELNDVGAAVRTNVDRSYRTGIEFEGGVRISPQLTWSANLTLSQNKIKDFREVLYDYGVNYDQYNEKVNSYKNTDISFSPNVIAGSMLSYSPLKGLDIALMSKYVGRQYLDNTSNSSRIIHDYFINDFRISYSLHPSFMKEMNLGLLLNNIGDVKYSSNGYTYGYFGGGAEVRQNYYYPQAGRNFLGMVTFRF